MSPTVHLLRRMTRGRYLDDTLETVDREHSGTCSVVSGIPHAWVAIQEKKACRGLCCNLTRGPSWDALFWIPHLLTWRLRSYGLLHGDWTQSCASISIVLLLRLQSIDPNREELLRKSALGLGLEKPKSGILEDGLKLLIGPGRDRHVRRCLVPGGVWTGYSRTMSNLPRNATVLVVEEVDTTGADVFLDHDEPISRGQDLLAPL